MNNNNKLSLLIIIGSIIGFAIIGVLNYNNGLFERTYDKSEVKCEKKINIYIALIWMVNLSRDF